jgi:transposase
MTASRSDHGLARASSFGVVGRAGVEGTGSYGASLCRYLTTQDVRVIEVDRPDRAMRRQRGKTDTIDAEAAACAVLAGRARTHPKYSEGAVAELRVAEMVKDSAVSARTQAINQLKAILVCADPQLREQLEPLRNPALFAACVELNPELGVVHQALQLLAVRIRHLSEQITVLKKQITLTIRALNSDLLKVFGVGPDSAAALLIAAGENHNRLTSEASFAALCGASPVEHSSGKSRHRRLNRGGNRQANCGALPHRPHSPPTRETNPALPRTTQHRGQDQTRDHPVSQALRGTRDLSAHSSRFTATTGTRHRLAAHRGINLNTHLTAGMRRCIADRDWLTVFQLPPYAPDLNPVEGIWSVLRRTTVANRAFADLDDLISAVRRGLRRLQYRHDVLDGCLTGTGLRRQPP